MARWAVGIRGEEMVGEGRRRFGRFRSSLGGGVGG